MSDIIAKEEVYTIVNQMYDMVAKSVEQSLVGNVMRDELKRFCDLVKDQVEKTEEKPFELHFSEDQYIRETFN